MRSWNLRTNMNLKVIWFQEPTHIRSFLSNTSKQQVKEILQKDIIEPSNGIWSAPIPLVKKKDGSLRFCVDYRQLNSGTVPDRFPIHLIQDIVSSLGNAKYFSLLDLLLAVSRKRRITANNSTFYSFGTLCV